MRRFFNFSYRGKDFSLMTLNTKGSLFDVDSRPIVRACLCLVVVVFSYFHAPSILYLHMPIMLTYFVMKCDVIVHTQR